MSWQNAILKFLLRPARFLVQMPVGLQRAATEVFLAWDFR